MSAPTIVTGNASFDDIMVPNDTTILTTATLASIFQPVANRDQYLLSILHNMPYAISASNNITSSPVQYYNESTIKYGAHVSLTSITIRTIGISFLLPARAVQDDVIELSLCGCLALNVGDDMYGDMLPLGGNYVPHPFLAIATLASGSVIDDVHNTMFTWASPSALISTAYGTTPVIFGSHGLGGSYSIHGSIKVSASDVSSFGANGSISTVYIYITSFSASLMQMLALGTPNYLIKQYRGI